MTEQPNEKKELKNSRIDLRATPREKTLIAEAAALSGKTLSDFIIGAALAKAQQMNVT
jgi:uncharacterized protein (DUF1778 family)